MKRLWAPWRLEYVRADNKDACFLCRILSENRDRENLLLKRGHDCSVVMNRYPYNNGHLMVFPHRHVAELSQLSGPEKAEIMDLAVMATEILGATIHPHGFNVGINLGRAAGAGLEEHLHTHIVPRWDGDTNFMPVLDDVRVIPQSLTDLWEQLHPVFNRK